MASDSAGRNRLRVAAVAAALSCCLVIRAVTAEDKPAESRPATDPATAPATATAPTTSPATAATTAPTTAPVSALAAAAPAAPEPGIHVVKRGSLSPEVKGEGLFVAIDPFEVKVAFKNFIAYGGPLTIKSIALPGATVKKGDSLLELDRQHLEWTLAAAETELAAAKAGMVKAESDAALGEKTDAMALKAAEDALKNAEAGQKWWEAVDGPQLLLGADLAVKAAQDSVDDQADELDQLRKMYKGEELTSATADIVIKRALRQFERSKITLKAQQEKSAKTKDLEYPVYRQRGIDGIENVRTSLASVKASQAQGAVTRAASLVAAKIALEQTTKKTTELREDAQLFSWKSPADGVVAYGAMIDGQWIGGDPKGLEIGDKIAAGQIVLRVFTPGKLRVVLPIGDSQAFWVENGMKARLTPAPFQQISYTATCAAPEIAPKSIPSAIAYQVTLDAGEVDRRILPGMKAAVQIDAGKVENALLIPAAALTAGKVSVRGADKVVTEKSVTLGMTDGQSVEIRAGLNEGDEVVMPGKR